MVSSTMELQLGVFGVLPTAHVETNAKKKCFHDLCALCCISPVCIFMLRSWHIRTWWWIKVNLTAGKPWIPPVWAPCQVKDGAGSGMCGLYLWFYERKWCYIWIEFIFHYDVFISRRSRFIKWIYHTVQDKMLGFCCSRWMTTDKLSFFLLLVPVLGQYAFQVSCSFYFYLLTEYILVTLGQYWFK